MAEAINSALHQAMERNDQTILIGQDIGVSGGVFRVGDEVLVLPSGFTSKIRSIDTMDGSIEEAFAPMAVSITLEDDIDVIQRELARILERENR